jgi:DNA end-binding protein Ku
MPRRNEQPEEAEERAGAHSLWSGTISFGLVSIPVDLFPAQRSERVALRMLAPDGTPLARRYVCPKEEREIGWDEIVRGYEVHGRWVVVTDEELEGLAPRKSRDIDLRVFVDRADLDPILFERGYFLAPSSGSVQAYTLLAETMEKTSRAGIATFVMRGKEYLIAIVAENGVLRAETMRFADEVRTSKEIGLPKPRKAERAAVTRMAKQIERLSRQDVKLAELEDQRSHKLLQLIEKKQRRGADVVEVAEATGEALPEPGVVDLMEILKQRMQARSTAAKGARKARGKRLRAS